MARFKVVYVVTVEADDEEQAIVQAIVQAHCDYSDGCGSVEVEEITEERGHRHNSDFCAKCGGTCVYDDQGELLEG